MDMSEEILKQRESFQQFLKEGHLRWDSLGEFCALVASFEHLSSAFNNDHAQLMADTLDQAIGMHLENGRNPSRKVNELDNRGSHFYLGLYWAQALAAQDKDPDLKSKFADIAEKLIANESKIIDEMNSAQGDKVDINGYYFPDDGLASKAMRPSTTLNSIIDSI